MSGMETIIRPFQRPTTIVDQNLRITTPVVAPPEKAIIVWGAAGQAPTLQVSGVNLTIKHNDVKMKETRRTTRTIRVQNPDDPSQFIIENRTEKLRLKTGPMAQPSDSSENFTPSSSGQTSNQINADNPNAFTTTTSGKQTKVTYYTEITLATQSSPILGKNETQVAPGVTQVQVP